MTCQYILKILNSCEALSGFTIMADFLAKGDKSVNVKMSENETIERNYLDGLAIFSKDIELDIRLRANEEKSISNRKCIEKILQDIVSWGDSRQFLQNQDDELPLKIKVIQGADIVSDDIHSVCYKMILRIYYLKKKRG